MRPLQQQSHSLADGVFSRFLNVEIPEAVFFNPLSNKSKTFIIKFTADGDIPFPQIIIRSHEKENILNGSKIYSSKKNEFIGEFSEGFLPLGTHPVQIEGCRKKEWQQSNGDDWIKWFGEIKVITESPVEKVISAQVKACKKKTLK